MSSNTVDSFERTLGRTAHRNWDGIRGGWLRVIPQVQAYASFQIPGSPPEFAVSEVVGLEEALKNLRPGESLRQEIPGLRPVAFLESIYLFHKATHILGAAESELVAGMPSWSLSSGYQSAFFSAKSILGLMGLVSPEFPGRQHRNALVDLWPRPLPLTAKQRHAGVTSPDEAEIVWLNRQLGHKEIWLLFKRMMAVSAVSFWPESIFRYFRIVDVSSITQERNILHYGNIDWLLGDLHDFQFGTGMGTYAGRPEDSLESLQVGQGLSLALAHVLLRLGMSLIKDLRENSNALEGEWGLVSRKFTPVRFPSYSAAYPGAL